MFLVTLFILLTTTSTLDSAHTSSFNIEKCKESSQLYTLEGRIMAIRYFKNYYHLPSLNLEACISDDSVVPARFDPFQMLWNVTVLELRGVVWPSLVDLPYDRLEEVTLWDVSPIGVWGPCSKLKKVTIHDFVNLTRLSSNWLASCTHLKELDLMDLTVTEIRTVVGSTKQVQKLDLWRIKDEPISLIANKQLLPADRRTLENIRILNVYEDIMISNKSSIHNLNNVDTKNRSTWADISVGLILHLSSLPRLEEIFVSNHNFDFCEAEELTVTFPSLEILHLYQTNTTQLCFKSLRKMPKLNKIFMNRANYGTPFIKFQFSELFSTPSPHLEINMNGRIINSFSFVRDDYLSLSDVLKEGLPRSNVTLSNLLTLPECDCVKDLWFARALQDRLVTASPEILCSDGSKLENMPCEDLTCKRLPCEGGCVCCILELGAGVLADCRDAGLTELPPELLRHTNLSRLLAPHNSIYTLPDELPDTLLFMDLSKNNVWHTGAKAVAALFSNPARQLRLSGNIVYCSCENKDLIITLQSHQNQVEDFDRITCAVNQQKLAEVNVTKLCEAFVREAALLKQIHETSIWVTVVLVFVATILVLGLILYYRRRDVQMFLFSQGWCLSCVQEEDLDEHLRYDVFLSFCHADTEVVLEKLLPVLDRDYSVCIHLRDWSPGELIPTHIALSVSQSRRTVVILSRHFVRSVWGRLEFQTARMSALLEGRVRVVLIVLDDVIERDECEGDMKAYIRMNTYLKMEDPWFWEKLKFALPHRPLTHELLAPSRSLQRINLALEQYNIEMRQIEAANYDANRDANNDTDIDRSSEIT